MGDALGIPHISTVAEIKQTIDRLNPQEYCELMSVIHFFEDDDWGRHIKADAAADKFATMNESAERHSASASGG